MFNKFVLIIKYKKYKKYVWGNGGNSEDNITESPQNINFL